MPLLDPTDRRRAEILRDLALVNPFLPERVALEKAFLGRRFVPGGLARSPRPDLVPDPNTAPLVEEATALLRAAQHTAARSTVDSATDEERELLGQVGVFVLYHRFHEPLLELALALDGSSGDDVERVDVPWFDAFERAAEEDLSLGGERLMPEEDAPHLLELCAQIARCFHNVFARIGGRSEAAVRLRAEIWQSVFTHDLVRYRRTLAPRMVEVPTLVTGPSGTGKELVAEAVGRSSHLPFDVRARAFVLTDGESFHPLAISSLSPTLVESELFGHKRGAFTGALDDRAGRFERCPSYGTVFLDELGEIDAEIQVKLLRVLQSRTFERIGEHAPRRFRGRLVSATNRDLDREIERGRFREDLYYRVAADRIETPSLRALVDGDSGELEHLVGFAAARLVGRDGDAAQRLAADTTAWIERELGLDHEWPGNFRELEQCVRSFAVRGSYRPRDRSAHGAASDPARSLASDVLATRVSADELLDRYCALVHDDAGTWEGAARRLGLDRRTVKARALRASNASNPSNASDASDAANASNPSDASDASDALNASNASSTPNA